MDLEAEQVPDHSRTSHSLLRSVQPAMAAEAVAELEAGTTVTEDATAVAMMAEMTGAMDSQSE